MGGKRRIGRKPVAKAGGNGKTDRARPFLKWAGGKGQLLRQFEPLFPDRIDGYVEPFVGSAAVFFHLAESPGPRRTVLADCNKELIDCYQAVRDRVEAVIEVLAGHRDRHGRDHFYEVRGLRPESLAREERAARLIYLNRTCFNGLYRVNSRGEFNVPIGRYANPRILDEDNLRRVNRALRGVELIHEPFEAMPGICRRDDFVYLDPPYQPVSATARFTSYTAGAFGPGDQERLAATYAELDRLGCRLMLSNSDSPLIRKLYAPFDIRSVEANRAINSRADRRGPVRELVILNF
jgi:DNA adenine methylase